MSCPTNSLAIASVKFVKLGAFKGYEHYLRVERMTLSIVFKDEDIQLGPLLHLTWRVHISLILWRYFLCSIFSEI